MKQNRMKHSICSFKKIKNNDTKDYSEQLEFLNTQPYYASKNVIQSSDFPVRRTGSYCHKKALVQGDIKIVATCLAVCFLLSKRLLRTLWISIYIFFDPEQGTDGQILYVMIGRFGISI